MKSLVATAQPTQCWRWKKPFLSTRNSLKYYLLDCSIQLTWFTWTKITTMPDFSYEFSTIVCLCILQTIQMPFTTMILPEIDFPIYLQHHKLAFRTEHGYVRPWLDFILEYRPPICFWESGSLDEIKFPLVVKSINSDTLDWLGNIPADKTCHSSA